MRKGEEDEGQVVKMRRRKLTRFKFMPKVKLPYSFGISGLLLQHTWNKDDPT